jgi:hypothetical protein
VEGWATEVRREQGREKFDEWFQWLADRMRECEAVGEAPAYLAFEDWTPRSLGIPLPASRALTVGG